MTPGGQIVQSFEHQIAQLHAELADAKAAVDRLVASETQLQLELSEARAVPDAMDQLELDLGRLKEELGETYAMVQHERERAEKAEAACEDFRTRTHIAENRIEELTAERDALEAELRKGFREQAVHTETIAGKVLQQAGEALEPFGLMLGGNYHEQTDSFRLRIGSGIYDMRFEINLGDLRKARAAHAAITALLEPSSRSVASTHDRGGENAAEQVPVAGRDIVDGGGV